MQSVSIGTSETYLDKVKLEFLEGYSFESGFLSPYFASKDKD